MMRRILSLFLGAMSFGTQGAYAGERNNVNGFDVSVLSKSKGKGRDTKDGRRVGRVSVNGDEALRIVKEAKSKGYEVGVKKIGRNKAEVTVTDKHGNVVTYIVGGVVFVLLIAAIIGVVAKCKGAAEENGDQDHVVENPSQVNGQERHKEEEEKKKKQKLISEIGELYAVCNKFKSEGELLLLSTDVMEKMEIDALEKLKSNVEDTIKDLRVKYREVAAFMLEFDYGDSAGNLGSLSDKSFAEVVFRFDSSELAKLLFGMMQNFRVQFGDASSSVFLEKLGYKSYTEIKDTWPFVDKDNPPHALTKGFGEWCSGKLWEDHKTHDPISGVTKTVRGVTFKDYLKKNYSGRKW